MDLEFAHGAGVPARTAAQDARTREGRSQTEPGQVHVPRRPNASRRRRTATFAADEASLSGFVEPIQHLARRGARMFVQFRPRSVLSCEHVFCSTRTSTLAQHARDALSLTRAFLLLEDDDPVDWEVGKEELALTTYEPAWARAHRAPLRGRRAPRRGGQPAPSPQPCLCPTGPIAGHREADVVRSAQRGPRITTGSPRVARGRHGDSIAVGQSAPLDVRRHADSDHRTTPSPCR
jgi:hypothetical protein